MLIRLFSILFVLSSLSGCAHFSKHTTHKKNSHGNLKPRLVSSLPPQPVVQNRVQGSFSQIKAKGNFNISLHTGYKKPVVILRGDARDLAQLHTYVKDSSLMIELGKGFPRYGAVAAEIRSRHLNQFSFKGKGNINGSRIHSGFLELDIDNSEQTNLSGSINLHKLVARGGGVIKISGIYSQYAELIIQDNTRVELAGKMNLSKLNLENGSLSLYWLKADFLSICAKNNSFIQLAGIVNKLDVELMGNARFNGRYLRAERAFVKTHDRSVAEMSAVKHQHTLATDASDIYFYNIPNTKADFMAHAGSVLDMRIWGTNPLEEYTRFNK